MYQLKKLVNLHTGRVGGHDIGLFKARCEALPAVVHLFILRAHNVPLVLTLFFLALDDVAGVGTAIHDVLALLLAANLDLAVERLRHGNDVGVGLIPGNGVGETFGTFAAFDGERPEQRTEESDEFKLGKVDARAGTVTVAKRCVATKVGEFSQGFFVCWVGGIDPALRLEFCRVGVKRFLAGNQTAEMLAKESCEVDASYDLLVVGVHDGILRNEVAVVNVVLECYVRHTEGCGLAPTQNLLHGRA